MNSLSLISLVFLILTSKSFAQNIETDSLSKQKIKKLAFIVGKWEGTGWMYGQDRNRYEFNQTEDIKFKLDSTVILIEGTGTSGAKIIHNALAIISFDQSQNAYNFHSYLSNGRNGKFKAELVSNKFYWYPMDNMRYIISINNKDQWYEIGEMKRGEDWFQFFEMILDRK
jgi:hypothetical protein